MTRLDLTLPPEWQDRTELTAKEYRQLLAEQPTRGNKYGAQRTEYAGVVYASTLEARVAELLDWLREPTALGRRRVVAVERQPRYPLVAGIVYVADFAVTWVDGRQTTIECKGVDLPVWRLKQRLMGEYHPEVALRVVRHPLDVVIIAEEG